MCFVTCTFFSRSALSFQLSPSVTSPSSVTFSFSSFSTTMPDDDLQTLSGLPLELQLLIADALGGRCDRAALALASPRLLGLAACLELTSYQGLEMSLAFHHVLGGAIDEQLLRRYASRSEATPEGCEWLAGVAAAAGVLMEIRVVVEGPTPRLGTAELWYLVQPHHVQWYVVQGYLVQPDSTDDPDGALLRKRRSGTLPGSLPGERFVTHYAGEEGAERLVRIEMSGLAEIQQVTAVVVTSTTAVASTTAVTSGVIHYEGEKGAERQVRIELPHGLQLHYEGEAGAERLVRSEHADGLQLHSIEGEKGAARVVLVELPSGEVMHLEGEGARSTTL